MSARERIDCVYTTHEFRCSLCESVHGPDPAGIPVTRITSAMPDWPSDSCPVDLLICPFCVMAIDRVNAEAPNNIEASYLGINYTHDELMALDREREEAERRFLSPGLTD